MSRFIVAVNFEDMQTRSASFRISVVRSEREWRFARDVREAVFVVEQACPPEEEWDEHDETSRHLVGYVDEEPVAVARWRAVSHARRIVAKLERFAVLKEYRGRGYGRTLVDATIEDARRAGFEEFLLHAQEHLAEFYASFGFRVCGDAFMEAGIRHVPMERLKEE